MLAPPIRTQVQFEYQLLCFLPSANVANVLGKAEDGRSQGASHLCVGPGCRSKFLALAWPSSGFLGHLGSTTIDEIFLPLCHFLFVTITLCHSDFQINQYFKKTNLFWCKNFWNACIYELFKMPLNVYYEKNIHSLQNFATK